MTAPTTKQPRTALQDRIDAIEQLRRDHYPGEPGRCICHRPTPCPVVLGCDQELARLRGEQQLPFAETQIIPVIRATEPTQPPVARHRHRRPRFTLLRRCR